MIGTDIASEECIFCGKPSDRVKEVSSWNGITVNSPATIYYCQKCLDREKLSLSQKSPGKRS